MRSRPLAALGLCALLAACQTDSGPAAGSGSGPATPAPAGAQSAPEQACIAKLSATAQAPGANISVASKEETLGGYLIMLNIAGADAPWRCLVDDMGAVEVEFTGEG